MALLIAAGARVVNIYAASDLIKHMSGTLRLYGKGVNKISWYTIIGWAVGTFINQMAEVGECLV